MRVEVGPKDVAQNACVTARRDRPGKAGKTFGVPMKPSAFVPAIQELLAEVSASCIPTVTSAATKCAECVATHTLCAVTAWQGRQDLWHPHGAQRLRASHQRTLGRGDCPFLAQGASQLSMFARNVCIAARKFQPGDWHHWPFCLPSRSPFQRYVPCLPHCPWGLQA